MAEEGVDVRDRRLRSARTTRPRSCSTEFDAIVLCGGATAARDLPVEGRKLRASTSRWSSCSRAARACSTATSPTGSSSAPRARTSSSSAAATPAPTASARRCATAARAWCSSRSCPRPPDRARRRQPVAAVAAGLQAGLRPGGGGRAVRRGPAPLRAPSPSGCVGDAAGNVKELHTVEVEWVKNGDGRFAMKEMPGTEKVWPADLVLLAMGFLGPEKDGLLGRPGRRARRARQRRRRRRQDDQRPGRVRRRRHGARPVADRVGDRGGPRRRPRRRPVPDGRNALP